MTQLGSESGSAELSQKNGPGNKRKKRPVHKVSVHNQKQPSKRPSYSEQFEDDEIELNASDKSIELLLGAKSSKPKKPQKHIIRGRSRVFKNA